MDIKSIIFKYLTILSLFIYSSIVCSTTVTYSFEGLTDFSFWGGESSVPVSASFTLDSNIPGVDFDCSPTEQCAEYGYGTTFINWDISIDGYTSVSPVLATSTIDILESSFHDRFSAKTDITPVAITSTDYFITGLRFSASDYDGQMFDSTALPLSINDFVGLDELEFGLLVTDNPDGILRDLLSLPAFSFEVTTVPLPAAVWLFGSGLIGLIGVARRKKA